MGTRKSPATLRFLEWRWTTVRERLFRGKSRYLEIPRPPGFGLADRKSNESQWLRLLETLIEQGIVNWKDIAECRCPRFSKPVSVWHEYGLLGGL